MYKKLGYSVYRRVLDYYSGDPDEDAYGIMLFISVVYFWRNFSKFYRQRVSSVVPLGTSWPLARNWGFEIFEISELKKLRNILKAVLLKLVTSTTLISWDYL